MFKTLKNAWRIPELKKKLLFTLLIVVLYRIGANIPVPYVDPSVFEGARDFTSGSILQFLNLLSGEALGKATLLALGVSPYITASIVIQLLTIAIPALERWSKDGENGRKKITALTRIVTVALALVTAIGYVIYLENGAGTGTTYLIGEVNFWQRAVMVLCFCAGAALVMWLAEKINESGIGNGISIILFANILAGLPTMIMTVWTGVFTAGGFSGFRWQGLILAILEIALLLGIIMLIVWMSDAERRIPIQYAKRVVGRKMYGGQNTNLPLKVNMAGVMPIIFANSIVAIPATIASFITNQENWFVKLINGNWDFLETMSENAPAGAGWLQSLLSFSYYSWPYLLIFLVLLIAFAFFYVMISFNPIEVANNIKNNGGAIPGIRSGRPTVDFIKKVLYRITLVGALLVAFIACFPMAVNIICSIPPISYQGFAALAFSGSSMMILVGVALETIRELEAQMSLRNYKGFLD